MRPAVNTACPRKDAETRPKTHTCRDIAGELGSIQALPCASSSIVSACAQGPNMKVVEWELASLRMRPF